MTTDECIEILKTIEKDRCTPIIPAYEHDAIELAIEALKREQWIPVSDHLPPELKDKIYGDAYLVSCSDCYCSINAWWDGKQFEDTQGDILTMVTAWKPLPEPYKEPEK